jgi:hypothetical protein
MKIHAIQTGTVALTASWREGVGHGRRRLLNTLLDREWTEPLPIYAFAIEHPEGVIVVDTGETARVAERGYLPRWSPFFRFAVREVVAPEQEIGCQLERLGITPSDIRCVVMSRTRPPCPGPLAESSREQLPLAGNALELPHPAVLELETRVGHEVPHDARRCA